MENNQTAIATTAGAATVTSKSLSPLIEQWANEQYEIDKTTRYKYKVALNYFDNYLLERGIDIESFTEPQLIEYRDFLKSKASKKEDTTAKYYFGRALRFISWLSKRGYIHYNIAEGIKGIKANTSIHRREAITADESAMLIASFDAINVESDAEWKTRRKVEMTLRNKAICALMIGCGLRTVEVCRLSVEDMQKQRNGQWTLRVHGKMRSGKGDVVVLPLEVKKLISAYLKVRGNVEPDAPMFVSTSRRNKGAGITPQTISCMVKEQLVKSGINSEKSTENDEDDDENGGANAKVRIVAHGLRHGNATIAYNNGVSIDNITLNLRHRSTATSMIYVHTLEVLNNPANTTVVKAVFGKLKELIRNVGS